MVLVCMPLLVTLFFAVCPGRYATGRHGTTQGLRQLNGLQRVYTHLPYCSALKPESVTMDTICLSSCGTIEHEDGVVCNPQAETWKIRLNADIKSGFSIKDDCPGNQKRFKCLPYQSNEIQCSDASFDTYPAGFSCFTQCGELKCPSNDYMTPVPANDFKLADCKSSYRVRCRIHPKNNNQLINVPDLTMELQIGHLKYGRKAAGHQS
ncbi:hypothetical protein BBOV_III007215 [Babesia bovis T2Bo]|uniref:hypothetical protein n=1 Tax=Babesia bovis T2Bo TaxID=484906 RepID=UPI001C3473FA|nr:hypothetical protein BBOV_III007215 [Babesia bovis T2Bo]KAG6440063.1 hypothetical protein BBOV_III007215 [Babesia bovis T2Bo]